jgi:hypothetical protein
MSQLSGLGRSDYAKDERNYVADRRRIAGPILSVTFIAYFAVPQSPGRCAAIHYSFIGTPTFLAWEDALNDCLGLLGESVSGAGSS